MYHRKDRSACECGGSKAERSPQPAKDQAAKNELLEYRGGHDSNDREPKDCAQAGESAGWVKRRKHIERRGDLDIRKAGQRRRDPPPPTPHMSAAGKPAFKIRGTPFVRARQ